jgi:hypothetical protein
VTSAAAIVLETLELRLSAIRTSPPRDSFTGRDDPSGKIKEMRRGASGLLTATRSAGKSPGTVPWKIQRSCSGILANTSAGTPKFLASTSGGVCMSKPVRQQQGVELVGVAVVEADHEFATIGSKPLQRVRRACREYQRPTAFTTMAT